MSDTIVTVFAISELKLKTFVRITVVVQKSSSPLRSSAIIIGKITNSLKPRLKKKPFEFETKKKTYRLLKLSHKLLKLSHKFLKLSHKLLKLSHKFLNF